MNVIISIIKIFIISISKITIKNKYKKEYKYIINKINLSLNESIGIVIGPEGDFSPNEMTDLGSIKNSVPVTLGSNILKSETAGVVATSLVMNSIYND